jgi:hypothetical protein
MIGLLRIRCGVVVSGMYNTLCERLSGSSRDAAKPGATVLASRAVIGSYQNQCLGPIIKREIPGTLRLAKAEMRRDAASTEEK